MFLTQLPCSILQLHGKKEKLSFISFNSSSSCFNFCSTRLPSLLRLLTAPFHCPDVEISSDRHWAAVFCVVDESIQYPLKVFLRHARRPVTAVEIYSAYLYSHEVILRVFHDLLEGICAAGPDGCGAFRIGLLSESVQISVLVSNNDIYFFVAHSLRQQVLCCFAVVQIYL